MEFMVAQSGKYRNPQITLSQPDFSFASFKTTTKMIQKPTKAFLILKKWIVTS